MDWHCVTYSSLKLNNSSSFQQFFEGMSIMCYRPTPRQPKVTRPFECNETAVFPSLFYTLQESPKGDGNQDYHKPLCDYPPLLIINNRTNKELMY